MKKSKLKQLIKEARSSAKKDIELSVVNNLKEVTAKLALDNKSFEKQIVKAAKQLAKKLSKEIKIDKTAFTEPAEVISDKKEAKTSKKESSDKAAATLIS